MRTILLLGVAVPLLSIGCSRGPRVTYVEGASIASCGQLSGDLATAGHTIFSGTPYDGTQTAFAAFDQNSGTYATLASSATTFIGQDFGGFPQQLQHLTLTGTVSYGLNAKLQYSDDAATWTDAGLSVDVPPSSTTPVDVDVPDVGGAHRYWRLLDQGGYDYMQIASAAMFACAGSQVPPSCGAYGSDLESAAATISTGTPYDAGQAAANAFDQNSGTYATLASSPTTMLGQDFGASPQEIRRVILTGTVSYGFNAKLQYSDDGTTWSDTTAIINVPPFSSTPVQVDVDSFGMHRFWAFLDMGAYNYVQIASIQLLGCAPVVATCSSYTTNLETTSATISSGTAYDETQTAANAFDQNLSTYTTLTSSPTTFVGQDFGATPQEIRRVVLTGTVSYGFDASIQYSDDGTNWVDTGVDVSVPEMSSTPVQVDVPALGAHQYWRFLDRGVFDYLQIASIELFGCAGACTYASDVATVAGTISDGTPYDETQVASNAFDQNGGTYSTLATSASTFIGQDFGGTPQEIRRIVLSGTVSFGFAAKFQYSDDAVTWTDTGTTIDVPPMSASPMQADIASSGPHRYWRLFDLGSYEYFQIASAEMRTCF